MRIAREKCISELQVALGRHLSSYEINICVEVKMRQFLT